MLELDWIGFVESESHNPIKSDYWVFTDNIEFLLADNSSDFISCKLQQRLGFVFLRFIWIYLKIAVYFEINPIKSLELS